MEGAVGRRVQELGGEDRRGVHGEGEDQPAQAGGREGKRKDPLQGKAAEERPGEDHHHDLGPGGERPARPDEGGRVAQGFEMNRKEAVVGPGG